MQSKNSPSASRREAIAMMAAMTADDPDARLFALIDAALPIQREREVAAAAANAAADEGLEMDLLDAHLDALGAFETRYRVRILAEPARTGPGLVAKLLFAARAFNPGQLDEEVEEFVQKESIDIDDLLITLAADARRLIDGAGRVEAAEAA